MGLFGGGATGMVGTGVVYALVDKFSNTADRIAGKWNKLEGATTKSMERMNSGVSMLKKGLAGIAVGAAIIGGLALAVNAAIEFESAFTGVRKTVELTEPGFVKLEENIRNMANSAPISATSLANIGELAGQLGVSGVDDITKFIDTIAKISVTTNLTEDAAATSFARIANIMNEPITNVDRMASTVVGLGNSFATTEAEITEFGRRMAGASRIAGLSTADVFGIATAFTSVGVGAEAGGTAVSKSLFAMKKAVETGNKDLQGFADVAGMTAAQFKSAFQKDAKQGFEAFVKGLGKNGIKATTLLDELGLSDSRLMQGFISVAGAGDLMTRAISKANTSWDENTALTKEANLRFNTTESQLIIMKNNFIDLGITIGKMFLPAIRMATRVVKAIVQGFNRFAKTEAGGVILKIVAAIGLFIGIGGAIMALIGLMKIAMVSLGIATWTALIPFIKFIAIAALIAAPIIFLWKSVEKFNQVLDGSAEPASGFLGFMQRIGGVLKGVAAIFRTAGNDGFSMSVQLRDALEKMGILDFVVNLGTWIVRIKAFFVGIGQAFVQAWGVVKVVWGAIKTAFNAFVDVLNKLGFNIDKLGGSMDAWVESGKIVGQIIVGVLIVVITILIIKFIALAIAVIAATWPILLIIAIIVAVIAIIVNWGSIMDWIGKKWGELVTWMGNKIMDLFKGFVAFHVKLIQFGIDIIKSIGAGFMKGKDWLFDLLLGIIADLPGGELILDALGIAGNGQGDLTPVTTGPLSQVGQLSEENSQNRSLAAQGNDPIIFDRTVQNTEVRDVNFIVDGRVFKEVIDEQNDQEDSQFD